MSECRRTQAAQAEVSPHGLFSFTALTQPLTSPKVLMVETAAALSKRLRNQGGRLDLSQISLNVVSIALGASHKMHLERNT